MRPSIGFDRDIKLEWLDAVATQVSAGQSKQEVRAFIHKMLGEVLAGAAVTKSTTVLLHIWSQVPTNALALRDRVAPVISNLSPQERLAAHWSMCMATYPFFLDVATNVGRLMALQGDVSLATLRRRLAERWGDRSILPQATRKVIRSMVAWEMLRDLKPGLYAQREPMLHVGARASTFLVEALLIGSGQKSMAITDIERHPAFFPFRTSTSIIALRAAKQFAVHSQGVDMAIVELAQN